MPVTAKSGEKLFFDFSFSRIYIDGAVVGAQGTGVDITERKRAEEALRQSEEKYRTILESFQEGYFEVDLKGNFTFCNDSMYRITGYSKEEWLGMNYRVYTDEETGKKVYQEFNNVYTTGEPSKRFDWPYIRKDGTIRYIEASIILQKDSSGKPTGFKGMVRDITERKLVERKLIDSEEKFRMLAESSSFAIGLYRGGRWIYANRAAEEISGYTAEELYSMHFWDIVHPDYQEMVKQRAYNRQQGKPLPFAYEFKIITKNGVEKWLSLIGNLIQYEDKPTALISVEDITERKNAVEAIRKSELKYRNIFENAMEGIYQSTIEGRFIIANAALARMARYDSPEELIESIKDIGTQLYVNPEDRKRFMEIKDAKGFVEGFEAEFYKKDGSTFWVVINARTVKDEQGKILYNEGLIEDITIRKYAEKQLQQTLESLRKAVGATIQVLVSALESRDPYTSGHQSRSADLACAIATEMGLAPEKIEGIHMAGIIHDIGKLSIPVEILSKPTKLTDIEFSLIKEHSRCGYGMLKNVESPWPLAEIVYQHHERMNGSGYPRNLKGEEILMESRILAVADVVEAMASHRPYRPTLGIDAALEEIEKNKGLLYDNVVAAACLKLFREKGYKLA
jgi:PAS domain S-box-containing protein